MIADKSFSSGATPSSQAPFFMLQFGLLFPQISPIPASKTKNYGVVWTLNQFIFIDTEPTNYRVFSKDGIKG